jgi:hypothetical protein
MQIRRQPPSCLGARFLGFRRRFADTVFVPSPNFILAFFLLLLRDFAQGVLAWIVRFALISTGLALAECRVDGSDASGLRKTANMLSTIWLLVV